MSPEPLCFALPTEAKLFRSFSGEAQHYKRQSPSDWVVSSSRQLVGIFVLTFLLTEDKNEKKKKGEQKMKARIKGKKEGKKREERKIVSDIHDHAPPTK